MAAQMVALRLDKSEEEIAAMAGATFFPQPNEKNETCYDHGDEARTAAPNDTPFTLAELQAALDVANVRSAPGPDCVSFAELRNLPTEFKRWGTGEKETRQLVQSLFSSRIFYGYNYHHVTTKQQEELEKLNREAIRIVTGLPKYTWTADLYSHGGLNRLADVAEQLLSAQRTRLLSTRAGQRILAELGDLPQPAPPIPPVQEPPWERQINLTDDAPLPSHMGPDHPERRSRFATAHEKLVKNRDGTKHVCIYTDAAAEQPSPEEPGSPLRTSIAWVDTTTLEGDACALPPGVGVKGAELEAILRAAIHAEERHSVGTKVTDITIYTDSREAYSECRNAIKSQSERVRNIHDVAKRLLHNRNVTLRVDWVPAHAGIRANEWAHSEARAALRRSTVSDATNNTKEPRHAPAPSETGPPDDLPDSAELAAIAKKERKAILLRLRQDAAAANRHNREIPPMPPDLNRRAQVTIRRIITNTALTPALRHKMFGDDPNKGKCRACAVPATTSHLVWECPTYGAARERILSELPAEHRPTSYIDWILPQDTSLGTVQLLWKHLCLFVHADGGPGALLLHGPPRKEIPRVSPPPLLMP
ncbi:hypothetical protein HPB47_023392 [Ixodes persulcatus]|uniref:Uncharacterized protein n=1 Tax=Ixodes persulcatus TaxID=34615 RepID=A0AC60R1W8_IXOPE|nr:hypothetical protein HPB47_023392 [Ixodes persulcatus]